MAGVRVGRRKRLSRRRLLWGWLNPQKLESNYGSARGVSGRGVAASRWHPAAAAAHRVDGLPQPLGALVDQVNVPAVAGLAGRHGARVGP